MARRAFHAVLRHASFQALPAYFILRHFLMHAAFQLSCFLSALEFSQRCMPPRVSLMPLHYAFAIYFH
jgi:hypothetical protein